MNRGNDLMNDFCLSMILVCLFDSVFKVENCLNICMGLLDDSMVIVVLSWMCLVWVVIVVSIIFGVEMVNFGWWCFFILKKFMLIVFVSFVCVMMLWIVCVLVSSFLFVFWVMLLKVFSLNLMFMLFFFYLGE